jgi:hypothetical protein
MLHPVLLIDYLHLLYPLSMRKGVVQVFKGNQKTNQPKHHIEHYTIEKY